MGSYKFAIKLMGETKRENRFYMISIAVATALIFNFFNVLHVDGSGFENLEERTILGLIVLLVIAYVLFLTFYANNYLSELKSKELALEMLSGIPIFKVGRILTFQSLILNATGAAAGSVLSFFLVPIFCLVTKSDGLFLLSKEAFIYTAILLLIQVTTVGIVNFGYGFRTSITSLLSNRDGMAYVKEDRKKKFSWYKIRYFIYSISPLCLLFFTNDQIINNFYFVCILIAISFHGNISITNKFIPMYIDKIKEEKYLNDKIKLLVLNNLKVKLYNSKTIINIIFFTATSVMVSMQMFFDISKFSLYNRLTFFVCIFLVGFMIVYVGLTNTLEQSSTLCKLSIIGYKREDILKIIKKECIYLYSIMIGNPLILILSYLIVLVSNGIFSIKVAIGYVIIFVGLLIISAVASSMGCIYIIKSEFNKKG